MIRTSYINGQHIIQTYFGKIKFDDYFDAKEYIESLVNITLFCATTARFGTYDYQIVHLCNDNEVQP